MTKRRSFTAEFKARVVIEDLMGIKDRAELCREHRLRPQLLGRWRREFMERAPELFSSERQGEKEQARIDELAADRRTVYEELYGDQGEIRW